MSLFIEKCSDKLHSNFTIVIYSFLCCLSEVFVDLMNRTEVSWKGGDETL